MKRTLISALLGLLLLLALGATGAAADNALDCVSIRLADEHPLLDKSGCSPGDEVPPPNLLIELPDGGIIRPTQ